MKVATLKNSVVERQQTPGYRWIRQAAELCARRMPGTLAYNFPRLEFLRQAAASYRVNYQWQRFVARFYPQIHLAIQPLLRKTLWADQNAHRVPSEYALASAQRFFPRRSASEAVGFKASASLNSQAMTYQANSRRPKWDSIEHATALAERLRRYTMRQVEVNESNLELIVRRLAHQMQRVEERLPGVPQRVVRMPAPAVIAAERQEMPEPERFLRRAKGQDTVNEAPWARAATAPSLSIEQLTDQVIRQIDSRVIAMRERMGRI